MKYVRICARWVLAIGIVCNLLLLSFEHYALNDAYYTKQFLKLEVHEAIGLSTSDLSKVSRTLVDYMDGEIPTLDVDVYLEGRQQPFFNAKEIQHMVDVKQLFDWGKRVLFGAQLAMLIAIVVIALTGDRRSVLGALKAALLILTLLIVLGVGAAALDFNAAFVQFHEIFFPNDLWLLNPLEDRLIQLMPLEFFIQFTQIWLATCAALYLGLGGIYFALRHYHKKKQLSEIPDAR
ncbi:TIGR01906 family membrane protein [Fusibacter sp. JL298sf-3]